MRYSKAPLLWFWTFVLRWSDKIYKFLVFTLSTIPYKGGESIVISWKNMILRFDFSGNPFLGSLIPKKWFYKMYMCECVWMDVCVHCWRPTHDTISRLLRVECLYIDKLGRQFVSMYWHHLLSILFQLFHLQETIAISLVALKSN